MKEPDNKAPKKRSGKVADKAGKKRDVRIVEDEKMLILTPQQFVDLANDLQKIKVQVQESEKFLNLLSPERYGWGIVESLPGLFVLYRRGVEYRAVLSEGLALLDARFKKGQQSTKDYDAVMKLQRGLFYLIVQKEAEHLSDDLRGQFLADFVDTIGTRLHAAWHNSSQPQSKIQADNIKNLFAKALDGLMRLKFPERAKSSGANQSKERIAIAYARELCEWFGRHPTKTEVRSKMEEHGLGYVVSRGREKQKWKDLFARCGLEGLKD
jgi:hypothetical protein